MKAIVAVDRNWGIGFKGGLLQRIPEDMRNFKSLTIGKVVVMGRETFESLPGKEPLKDRVNIVLSRRLNFTGGGFTVCHSTEELFDELKKFNPLDICIIGGEQIYTQLLPFCEEAIVTKIDREYEADRHFVCLDKDNDWELAEEGEPHFYNDIKFRFTRYRQVNR